MYTATAELLNGAHRYKDLPVFEDETVLLFTFFLTTLLVLKLLTEIPTIGLDDKTLMKASEATSASTRRVTFPESRYDTLL